MASATSLRRAYSVADDVIRALKASQREERDSWLIQLLLNKLDPETRQQWADRSSLNNGNAQPPSIDQFLDFLDQRAFTMEAIHRPISHRSNDTSTKSAQRHCSSFITTNTTEVPICTLCTDQQHHLYFCQRFKNLSSSERLRLTKELGVCSNCLRDDHGTNPCPASRCRRCDQAHHTLLHDGLHRQSSNQLSSMLSYNDCSSVLLATAVVHVFDTSGEPQSVRAILDSASQGCFITEYLRSRLNLPPEPINHTLYGIVGNPTTLSEVVKITLQSRFTSYRKQVQCAVLDKISDPLPQRDINIVDWNMEPYKPLADETFNTPSDVNLLIGANIFFDLLYAEKGDLGPTRPVLQNTKLGWIISGNFGPVIHTSVPTTTNRLLTVGGVPKHSFGKVGGHISTSLTLADINQAKLTDQTYMKQ